VIVTDAAGAGVAASVAGPAVHWGCLARRGMLYSECEAVDHLELAPGAVVTTDGRHGIEEAWYVIDGDVELDADTGPPASAGRGDLVLRPAGATATVRNPSPDTPARLLLIAVLPPAVTDRLPRRRPALDAADATPRVGDQEALA
jgi:mannose-6-phosphate isomerase-like protein (cupin superfamily)